MVTQRNGILEQQFFIHESPRRRSRIRRALDRFDGATVEAGKAQDSSGAWLLRLDSNQEPPD